MKKKNLLFTKVLFAVLMTIMVLGVNKQTAMAGQILPDTNAEYVENSNLKYNANDEEGNWIVCDENGNIVETIIKGYDMWVYNPETHEYDWTNNFVHEHDYEEYTQPASEGSDGYYYYICEGQLNYYSGCDYSTEGCGNYVKGDTIYAPKKIKLSKTTYYYTGKKIKPTVTVYDRKGNVIDSKYYTVSYENNKYVGTATVKVTFKGKFYSGVLTKTFSIKAKSPEKTSIKSLKAYGKGFLIEINKSTDSTLVGYQVQYSKTKDFKNAKSFYVPKGTTKVGKTSLSKSTKYYVRVRVMSDMPTTKGEWYSPVTLKLSTRVYSKWSDVKSVTTSSKDKSSPLLYTIFYDNRNLQYYYVKKGDAGINETKTNRKLLNLHDDFINYFYMEYFDAIGKSPGGASEKEGKKYDVMFTRTPYDGITEGTTTPTDFGIILY
jgi:hypothetical protein